MGSIGAKVFGPEGVLGARYPRAARSLARVVDYSKGLVERFSAKGDGGPAGAATPRGFTINHVGMAVPNIETFLEANKLLYANFQRSHCIVNERQHVRELFLTDGKTVIELLEPTAEKSPMTGFLRKNPSGGLVHVCFDCDDVADAIRRLKGAGGLLITGPTPDVAFDERPIAFLLFANQVIELVERARTAAGSI